MLKLDRLKKIKNKQVLYCVYNGEECVFRSRNFFEAVQFCDAISHDKTGNYTMKVVENDEI